MTVSVLPESVAKVMEFPDMALTVPTGFTTEPAAGGCVCAADKETPAATITSAHKHADHLARRQTTALRSQRADTLLVTDFTVTPE